MRRISLLTVAFILALFAASLALPTDGADEMLAGTLSIWRLRDGLLLAAGAIALAAWAATGYPLNWNLTTWSAVGRATIGAGLATAILGLLLRVTGVPNAHLVWRVGILIALAGIALPAVVTRFSAPNFRWHRGCHRKPPIR